MKLVNALMGAGVLAEFGILYDVAGLLNWHWVIKDPKYNPTTHQEYEEYYKETYKKITEIIKKVKNYKSNPNIPHEEFMKYKHQTLVGLRAVAREMIKSYETNTFKYIEGDLHP